MAKMTVKKGNYGFTLSFSIYESDGSTQKNISTYSGSLFIRAPGASTYQIAGSLAMGTYICTYTMQVDDADTVGFYFGEVQLYKAGIVEDTEDFEFYIVESVSL